MNLVKKFLSYYRPHWKLFLADMICSLLVALCDLFYPTISGNIIDKYVPSRELRLMLIWSAALLGIFILKAGLSYFIQYYGHCVGVRMQADMRREIFRHMQKLPFPFFDSHKTGSIMSRIVNDLMDVSELAHHGPENIFTSTVMLVASFLILCSINLWLTVGIFCLIPVLILFASRMRGRMDRAFTKTREEIAGVNANLENSLSGIRVAKAFTSSDHEEAKFEENNGAFLRAREFAYRTMAEFHSGMGLLTDMLNLVVLAGAGVCCYYGYITAGEFVKYLLYINIFLMPIRRIIDFIEQFQNGMSGYGRFREILAVQPDIEDAPDAREIGQVKGEIRFEQVDFRYTSSKGDVLHHLDMEVRPGEYIALVGSSGVGKSTLCSLIPRFYEVSEGVIRIDGTDIRDMKLADLRNAIGIVQQDVYLFSGTVMENILYGNPDASREDAVEAAEKAGADAFIRELKDGYDTYVGERGVKLSGGQKQRISIARVFLKNPPIMILDEATSALDNESEFAVAQSLHHLSEGRTTITIAHRLSSIKNSDRILVLTDQGITEEGNHESLMAQKGTYYQFYTMAERLK